MKNKQEVFIFDLDDTLLECQYNYCRVITDYTLLIVNHFKRHTPHPSDITRKQSEVDIDLIETYGYQKERFPQGLVETYKHFHTSIFGNEDYCEEFITKILELGYSVYEVIPNEIPNAIELLEYLKSEGKILYLLTAGQKDVQMFKINNTRVHQYFSEDQIFINETKKVSDFQNTLNAIYDKYGHIEKENIYMIGDSLRNDIQTSMELGLNAIHVDVATWSYNHVEVEHDYLVVKDLEEIEKLINVKNI